MSTRLLNAGAVSANRQGEITTDQRQTFISVSTSGQGGCVTLGLAALLLIPIILLFGKQLASLQGAAQILGAAVIVGVLIIAAVIVNWLYSFPARYRAASLHIDRRNGQVVFTGGQYAAVADGQRLRSIYMDDDQLLPGSYLFYCLKGTIWLASAEKLADEVTGSAMPDGLDPSLIDKLPEAYKSIAAAAVAEHMDELKSQTRFDVNALSAALASANGFDLASLDFNRRGKLSPSQIATLKRERRSYFVWALLLVIFGVGVIGLGIVNHAKLEPKGVLAILAFFGLVSGYMFVRSRSESADLRRGVVEMVEGQVHKFTRSSSSGRSSSTFHYYSVNNLNFEVSQAAYHALIEHVRYRIYYTPISKTLMSIEPAVSSGQKTPAESA